VLRERDGKVSPGAAEMLATKLCQGVPRADRCHTSRLLLSVECMYISISE